MITYRNKFIRIQECWDEEEPDSANVDLIRRFQQPRPIDNMLCREFYTILIDLRQDQPQLFASMKKDTRYEIRRGVRDGFAYELHDGRDRDVFNAFCDFYDEFALRMNQPRLRRAWLFQLAASDSLRFSRIVEENATLVWHGYHHSKDRVTLLYSASLLSMAMSSACRSKVGRANRFQHWQDLLRFKNNHIRLYDFGGWYEGKSDQKRLQINRFKEEFGGTIVKNYICERALTWKGALFLRVRQSLLGNAI